MATEPPFLDDNTTTRVAERAAPEDAPTREDSTGDPPPPDKAAKESLPDKDMNEQRPTGDAHPSPDGTVPTHQQLIVDTAGVREIRPDPDDVPVDDTTAEEAEGDASDDGGVDRVREGNEVGNNEISDGSNVGNSRYNESDDDVAIDRGPEPGQPDLPQQAGTIGGHPVFVETPPDLPDPLIAQDGTPPIDPDGGTPTIASTSGAGTRGVAADDAAEPLITSNLASLPTQVGTRDEPVQIVDDGDKPGEEGSAHEGARAGLADLVPDDLGSIGLDDLATGEEDTEDDSGSLDGLDRPAREAPAFADGGGTGGSSETSVSGGGGGKSSSETSVSGGGGGQQGQLQDEFDGRGAPSEDYAPGDYGADPDQPPSVGNASVEAGGDVSITGGAPVKNEGGEARLTEGQKELAKEYQGTWLGDTGRVFDSSNVGAAGQVRAESGKDVDEVHTSKDGVVTSVKHTDGTTTVTNRSNDTTTTLNPDGTSTTTQTSTGKVIDKNGEGVGTPAGDTEVVLTPQEQQELRDSIDALEQHRGDQGTETQPAEGDDGAFGASAPKSEIAITDSSDRAIDMLGQSGSSDLDFGGGAGGGNNSGDPNFGTIDPGESADAGRQTDGAEQDPFDRQQETLEQTEDSSDDDGGAGSPLQPGDLRPVEETEHLRSLTLDIG